MARDRAADTTLPDAAFRSFAEGAGLMIWRADRQAQLIYVNPAWTEFRGRSAEDELGHGWKDGLHPEDRAGHEAALARPMPSAGRTAPSTACAATTAPSGGSTATPTRCTRVTISRALPAPASTSPSARKPRSTPPGRWPSRTRSWPRSITGAQQPAGHGQPDRPLRPRRRRPLPPGLRCPRPAGAGDRPGAAAPARGAADRQRRPRRIPDPPRGRVGSAAPGRAGCRDGPGRAHGAPGAAPGQRAGHDPAEIVAECLDGTDEGSACVTRSRCRRENRPIRCGCGSPRAASPASRRRACRRSGPG